MPSYVIAPLVAYLDQTAGGGGDGTQGNPLNSLAGLLSVLPAFKTKLVFCETALSIDTNVAGFIFQGWGQELTACTSTGASNTMNGAIFRDFYISGTLDTSTGLPFFAERCHIEDIDGNVHAVGCKVTGSNTIRVVGVFRDCHFGGITDGAKQASASELDLSLVPLNIELLNCTGWIDLRDLASGTAVSVMGGGGLIEFNSDTGGDLIQVAGAWHITVKPTAAPLIDYSAGGDFEILRGSLNALHKGCAEVTFSVNGAHTAVDTTILLTSATGATVGDMLICARTGEAMQVSSLGNPLTVVRGAFGSNKVALVNGDTLWQLYNLQALATATSSISSTLSTVNSTVNTINTNVAGLVTSLASLTTTVGTINTNVAGLVTTTGTINTNVAGLVTSLASLTTTVGTINTNVAGLVTSVASITTTLGTVNTNVAGLVTSLASLTTTVGTINTNVAGLVSSLASLTTLVGTIDTNVAAIGTAVSSIGSTLSAVQAELSIVADLSRAVFAALRQLVTNVTAPATDSATSISVAASGSTTAGDYAVNLATGEAFTVDAVSGTTWTITRGALGTTASAIGTSDPIVATSNIDAALAAIAAAVAAVDTAVGALAGLPEAAAIGQDLARAALLVTSPVRHELASGATSGATSITLDDATGIAAGDWGVNIATGEVVLVTSIASAPTLSVTRAQVGTTARAMSSGDKFHVLRLDGANVSAIVEQLVDLFVDDAVTVVNVDSTRTVTIYEQDGVTIKNQVTISADGLTRTRVV